MMLKTALVAPMPRARERMAVRAKPGRLRSSRTAYLRSAGRLVLTCSYTRRPVKSYVGTVTRNRVGFTGSYVPNLLALGYPCSFVAQCNFDQPCPRSEQIGR